MVVFGHTPWLFSPSIIKAFSFVFLRFGTRNEIPDNAAELFLGEWQLDTLVSESFDETGVLDSQIFEADGAEFLLEFNSDKAYSFEADEAYLLSIFANSGIWQVIQDTDNESIFFLRIENSNNQNQINAIAEKYGTDYFLWTGVISLREKNNYKPLLVGIFAPYVLPLLIPNVVQPEYDMLYYAILFDIKTGRRSIIKA